LPTDAKAGPAYIFKPWVYQVATTIAENFGFMYSARGRFAFLVLLSTLCFGLDLIGKVKQQLSRFDARVLSFFFVSLDAKALTFFDNLFLS
jgi:hypothetical protein